MKDSVHGIASTLFGYSLKFHPYIGFFSFGNFSTFCFFFNVFICLFIYNCIAITYTIPLLLSTISTSGVSVVLLVHLQDPMSQ